MIQNIDKIEPSQINSEAQIDRKMDYSSIDHSVKNYDQSNAYDIVSKPFFSHVYI